MHELVLKINRDQAGALALALATFVRLCRRDMQVLRELLETGFIPVFDSTSTWRSRPATRDVVWEFVSIVDAMGAVIGTPVPEGVAVEGEGGIADAVAQRVAASMQDGAREQLAVVCSLQEGQVVAEALDAYTRIGMGQIMIVSELLRFGTVKVEGASSDSGMANLREVDRFEALVERLRGSLNFSAGQSLGVGNRSVKVEAHRAWEMCKVVRQALAMHRDPSPAFRGVHYDGLDLLRYTKDPKPRASIKSAEMA